MHDLLLHVLPEAVFIYDEENLKFLDMNSAALNLYGYTRDEFLQMDLTDLYAPEDIQTLIESSSAMVEENKYTGPFRHKSKSGSSIVVLISRSSVDYNGRKAFFTVVKKAGEDSGVNHETEMLKTVYENINEGIIVTDLHGFIEKGNSPLKQVTGYDIGDLEKAPLTAFVDESTKNKLNSEVFRAKPKSKLVLKVKIQKKNGDVKPYNAKVTPAFENGELKNYIIFLEEEVIPDVPISAPVNNESANDSHGGEDLDTSFLSHLFHELLTPINVIIGFGQELTESIENPNEEQKEAIDIIQENQKSLLQMMDTAGEYASMIQKHQRYVSSNVVFVDLIDFIEENSKKVSRHGHVKLAYGKVSSSLSFETDKNKFITLVSQFIQSSIQITSSDKVYLSAQPYDKDHFVVSIKDNKSSISSELVQGLRDVFSIDENLVRQKYGFSRFSTRLIRKIISLFECKTGVIKKSGVPFEYGIIIPNVITFDAPQIEEKHEDEEETITFEPSSNEVVNTKPIPEPEPDNVTFDDDDEDDVESLEFGGINEKSFDDDAFESKQIQQKPEPKKEPVKPTPPPVVNKPKPVPAGKIDLPNLSCIYLEDQVDSQILFKVQMKELKKIEVANSLEAAFPILEAHQFDFIVMDINLQGEYNGLDALRIVKQLPGYGDIPIIAVTAYVLPGDRDKFIAAGFSDFISKPVLKDNLTASLKKVLHKG